MRDKPRHDIIAICSECGDRLSARVNTSTLLKGRNAIRHERLQSKVVVEACAKCKVDPLPIFCLGAVIGVFGIGILIVFIL